MSSYYHIGSRIDHLSCEILLVSTGLEGIFISPVRTYDNDVTNFTSQFYVSENFGIDGVKIDLSGGGIIITESVQISVQSVCPSSPVVGVGVVEDGYFNAVYFPDDRRMRDGCSV